ncbi:MAG: lipid-binding SYLF domain-containing protein [Desulfarculaceae bacterium]|nr:lipid-binding SYLF domain-containing protein [Desulfarculaceae bacterium]MCF8073553.1 lipid-binding SYLF domain-containing protein [Desulfarculaceae bacterium]MCF8103075.1 lipid-binding SYLF domain-containing protein [Desulfarculaceae bacterium]MCF8115731.1 lipid-binding SYLF domain-containing protein [Desulfarculaceae bacterium]
MKLTRMALTGLMVLVLIAAAAPAGATDKLEAELKVQQARISFLKFMDSPDAGTPRWMLKRCRGVALFPGMIKAGFIVGGNYGTGVILSRKADGTWSGPAFFEIGGASLGLQIGASSTDVFMVIMTEVGMQALLKNQVKLGADASVAAGPVGRDTSAALTGGSFKADVYSYSRSAGLFAGAMLSGAGIEYDRAFTKAYYGTSLNVGSIFKGIKDQPKLPESAQQLIDTLNKYD